MNTMLIIGIIVQVVPVYFIIKTAVSLVKRKSF
jgi:hypothetical protein